MRRAIPAFLIAAATPFPALAGGFQAVLETYVEQCGKTVTEPGTTFSETDFSALPTEQVSWSEDGKIVAFTDGSNEDYTIYMYSDMDGQIRSTCSRSITADVTAEEIDKHLRDIEGAFVIGGRLPLIYASGQNAYSRVEDTHTWQVDLPQWHAEGVAFHVQIQSSTMTLTAFGGLSNSD